jgi:carbonic anhydrase
MDILLEGYRRFRAEQWPREREHFERLSREGQRPPAMVIACSDSRVDPQMIFAAGPGELFVVRNVANLVPRYQPDSAYHGTSAAIEFAVRALAVRCIVVLGHAQCGGIGALLDGPPPGVGDFVEPWMGIAAEARARTQAIQPAAARQRACEHEAIRVSLGNLRTFPWIESAARGGQLALEGFYFDTLTGELHRLGADDRFALVT